MDGVQVFKSQQMTRLVCDVNGELVGVVCGCSRLDWNDVAKDKSVVVLILVAGVVLFRQPVKGPPLRERRTIAAYVDRRIFGPGRGSGRGKYDIASSDATLKRGEHGSDNRG